MVRIWHRLSFAGRLLATASTALIVAGAVMLFVAARREAEEIRADLKMELRTELATLPMALAETVAVGDFATLQQVLNLYAERPLVVAVEFMDTTGTVLRATSSHDDVAPPRWFAALFDFTGVEGGAPVIVGGRSYGDLRLRLTANGLAVRAWSHLESHMAILLLAVLIDFAGIWVVLRSGLAPLKRLDDGAREIAHGRLDVQLASDGSPELRSVIHSFNSMARAVGMAQSALRASEEQLAYVMDATGEGIWDWDIAANRVSHNEQWGRIIGLNSVPDSHVVEEFLKIIHPDDRTIVSARVNDALAGRSNYRSEHRLIRVDGSQVWVLDRGKVVERDQGGNPLRMVGSIADITQQKQSEAALIEAKTVAESASQAKSRFLAMMSHEIRTPMNGILGMTEAMKIPGLSDEERQQYIDVVLTSGNTLMTLLNDVLDLAKVEAGKLTVESSVAFMPQQVIDETASLFTETAMSVGLPLRAVWTSSGIDRYEGDPCRIRQILSNLVNNAIKFTRSGCVTILAREIGRVDEYATLEFVVTDTGIGIAPDKMSCLFEPFSQAEGSTTKTFGGTGLGLSIVRSLARLMGGDAGAESEPGQGSRFWVRIRVRIHREEGRADEPRPEAGWPGVTRRRMVRASEEWAH